ncbi:MFS transporter [Kibdelosporangium persicum]|uniref:MFS transporter n=1 Tax=Kibdelosporangium persicum TaxID=2698649 RepID=A0ABX2F9B1_9PSEU|nr:MFS transporter [Kibdelosporangium persicum]NRN67902.1 MFS transporter [Kibdelosporangium persicum]
MTATQETVTPLRRNREFRLLWVGQALSDFGSEMTALAVPLTLLAAGYAPATAGLLGTVVLVVGLVIRVPSGYLADRYDQRTLMLVCDLARLVAVAIVAVLAFVGPLPLWSAFALVIVSGVALEVFRPSQSKVVRRVVPVDQLSQAVSLNQARTYAATIVAPAAAGLLLSVAAWAPFAVDAVTFAISASCVALLARSPSSGQPAVRERFLRQVAAGWRYLVRDRFLRWSSLFFALLNVTFSALTFALILGTAGQPGGAAAVGVALSTAAVAGLAGSLIAPTAAKRLSLRTVLAAGPVIAAALLVVAWSGGGTIPFVAAFSTLCLFAPVTGAVLATILAKAVPEEIYGRVTAASSFTAQVLQPLGPLAAGILLTEASFGMTAGLFAITLSALAALAVLLPAPQHSAH